MFTEILYSAGLGALVELPTESIPTSTYHHNLVILYPTCYEHVDRLDPLYRYGRIFLIDYMNITSFFDIYGRYPKGSGFGIFIKNYVYVLKDFFFFSHTSYNIMCLKFSVY